MLLEDADPAVDRGRPVMGVTKRALTPWCLVLRCSKSRAEEISTWALPLPVYVLNICIPHAGAPPQTVLWQLASDGVGRRWLVAILLSSRQSLDPGDGYGWVSSLAAFCHEFGAFGVHHRAGGPMTGTLASLF